MIKEHLLLLGFGCALSLSDYEIEKQYLKEAM